jgi:multiple sugar transport system ATP-binding protein
MSHGIVQQVGTPTDIYDRPANTFVAGFIGSPAMNLIAGEIAGGVFRAPDMAVTGLREDVKGKVTLGFRAEDARVSDTGQISAPVYTMELLGEATMLAVRVGPDIAAVKAAKDFRVQIGDTAHIAVPAAACHLFDHATGQRLG